MEKIEYLHSDILKIRILKGLMDNKYHTPSELSLKLNTNGTTLLRNSKFLELINFIEIDVKDTKSINYFLKITNKGRDWFNKFRELLLDIIKSQ